MSDTPRASGEGTPPKRIASSKLAGIARELWLFASSPRTLVRRRRAGWSRPAAPWAVLGGTTAAVLVLLALYGGAFGSLVDNTLRAQGGAVARPAPSGPESPAPAPTGPPTLLGVDIAPSFFLGVVLPDLASGTPPTAQRMVVSAGFVSMTLGNVAPQGLRQGAFPFLMMAVFAAIGALCLYPPARLLGARGPFLRAFDLSILYFGYAFLTGALILVGSTVVLVHLLRLRDTAYNVGSSLAQIPMLVVLVRGYFASFAELFELPVWRVFASSLLGFLLSAVISPLVLLPGAYLALRFQPLWDLLF